MLAIITLFILTALFPYLPCGWFWYTSRLHLGMSDSGVQKAIGQPQQVFTNKDGTLEWYYKNWSGGTIIDFDTNGIIRDWTLE